MKFEYIDFETPLGAIYIVSYLGSIYEVGFGKVPYVEVVNNHGNQLLNKVKTLILAYFNNQISDFDSLPLFYSDFTPFTQLVYNELRKIPYGQILSYSDIANKIGNPKASRAVGNANGRNRLLILIPCHRVITSNNLLGGYKGGINIKKYLLSIEGVKIEGEKVLMIY